MRRFVFVIFATAAAPFSAAASVDFVKDIQPILREHCVECHGPSQQMNGLRLDRRRFVLPNRVGANNALVVPGKSEQSRLYLRVSGTRAGTQMPPTGPLPAGLIQTLKAWIDGGAEWPDEAAGARSAGAGDVSVAAIVASIREGDRRMFARRLRDRPGAAKARGERGWTALMYAAAYGDVENVRALLESGADPNVQNDDGATALMYATDDLQKTKLLLDSGAKPNLRSGEAMTALLIAAGGAGTYDVAKLLIERGADAKARLPSGRSALFVPALQGNLPLIRLLLAHGADPKGLVLASVRGVRCATCMELLLPAAAPAELGRAMAGAVMAGDEGLFDQVLQRGAKPHAQALHFAAISPAPVSKDVLRRLIGAGADVHAKASGMTARELARRNRNANLLEALAEAGVADDTAAYAPPRPDPAPSIEAAIRRSLPPLQRADAAFLSKAGCVSCHNNSLTAMTVAIARSRGLTVDEKIAKEQSRRIAAFLDENRENALENIGLPGAIDTVSYVLLGMASAGYPGDAITDAWAKYVRGQQAEDGSWPCVALRPPLESSDLETTAASIRVLRTYGPKSRRADYDRAAARGTAWLANAQARTVEDRAFQILGLVWGGGSRDVIRTAAQRLLALQAADGGWEQRAGAGTEAYSTGQALAALRESGVPADNAAFQRGIRYLRESQLADGSWYVASRAVPLQPYFDSEFPHGPDQFISAAATNWAAMALLASMR